MAREMSGLTIIIPTYQRADELRGLLESLVASLNEAGTEASLVDVCVVVDGSTDDTVNVALSFSDRLRLQVIERSNGGLAAARNTGWRSVLDGAATKSTSDGVRHPHIWFLDDDMRVSAEAIRAHLSFVADRQSSDAQLPVVRYGPCWIDEKAPTIRYLIEWHNQLYERLSTQSVIDDPMDIHFANTVVPLATLAEHHGFDESLVGWGCEDNELADRLLAAGVEFEFARAAAVWHRRERAIVDQLQDWRQSGRNIARVSTQRPALGDRLTVGFGPRRIIRLANRLPSRIGLRAIGYLVGPGALVWHQRRPSGQAEKAVDTVFQALHLLGVYDADGSDRLIQRCLGSGESLAT